MLLLEIGVPSKHRPPLLPSRCCCDLVAQRDRGVFSPIHTRKGRAIRQALHRLKDTKRSSLVDESHRLQPLPLLFCPPVIWPTRTRRAVTHGPSSGIADENEDDEERGGEPACVYTRDEKGEEKRTALRMPSQEQKVLHITRHVFFCHLVNKN